MIRTLLAGAPDDFMMVHHLVLAGSEPEIGWALAAEAIASFGWVPPAVADPVRARARRRWFAEHWPQHYGRMKGIAAAVGRDVEDDTVDFATLFDTPMPALCSAAWIRAGGRARVGRNLDFSTGTLHEMLGADPQPGERPLFSRPYVLETHPDDAYATIIAVVGDLTGCLDGINEHGLVVALLADDESGRARGNSNHPTLTPQAGLNEMHLLRYVLETCASVEEAKDALYRTKQYDEYFVVHSLIADRDRAFVWERDAHNTEHAIDADRDSLCVTNYMLHRCDAPSAVPDLVTSHPAGANMYERARILNGRVDAEELSDVTLWDALEAVRFDPQAHGDWFEPGQQGRTLWHAQYDVDARRVVLEYYLGDNPDGSPRRSAAVTLAVNS